MKTLKKYKGKLTEWIVFTFIFFFLYDIIWAVADFEDFKQSIDDYYICLFVDLVYCAIFSCISLSVTKLLLRQRFVKLAEEERSLFLRSVIVIIAINIFIAGVCELLMNVIESEFIEVDVWGTFFLLGIIASLLALIHMLLHYSDIIILKNKENLCLQKKYLKLQLDPHFVFNSLSSLAGMIEEEPQRAEEYVVRLSQVYRCMLFNMDQDYMTISEAMDFTRTYISLLNLKYNDKIILELDEEKVKEEDRILALSIQLLIENAVKHNSPQENNPLHIQISVQDNMLAIKNNRIYFHRHNDQIVESYGIGLKNLKQRYELECGKEIGYSVTHDSFEIRLPIIKKRNCNTTMRKILIIEDDFFSAKRLKKLIMDIDDMVDVHGPLKSVNDVVEELSVNNDYDLIFSDIRLLDGDVFEAFRKVRPNSFVIFTTAYDEYAMQAIKNNGLDYIMKPIDFKELCVAMGKIKMLNPANEEVHDKLNSLLDETCQYRERFLVSKGDELIMLYTDDISYISKTDNHVLTFTQDGTSYSLAMSMADLEMALAPDKFFRINRQYIANIKGIKKISLFFNSKLIVKLKGCNDDNIVISKEKTVQFKKWLDR